MTLKEQTIEEIKQLPPKDLTQAYNFILFLKEKHRPDHRKQKKSAYLRAREALSKCKASLSEDIIKYREDRL
jgi:hypothetical protein